MRLCERCHEHPTWSLHGSCRLCVECSDPNAIAYSVQRREETAARQRRGKPVAFDVQPFRPHRERRRRPPVLVPLPLLVVRGDAMTIQEIAAVLGMSEMGVRLVLRRALRRFADHWREMFGAPLPD